MQSLNYRIATRKPGDSVRMRIETGNAGRDVTVALSLPPENPPREAQTVSGRNPLGGAKIENLSPAAAVDLQMDLLARGVVIASVDPRGYAAAQGFQAGDIIRGVNGVTINRVGDLTRAVTGVAHWDITIERDGRRLSQSYDG